VGESGRREGSVGVLASEIRDAPPSGSGAARFSLDRTLAVRAGLPPAASL
jgi:hypothetical protein